MEGSDVDGAQLEGHGLEADILGGMARFRVDVSDAALAVLAGGPFINRREDDDGRSLGHAALTQRRRPEGRSFVTGGAQYQ